MFSRVVELPFTSSLSLKYFFTITFAFLVSVSSFHLHTHKHFNDNSNNSIHCSHSSVQDEKEESCSIEWMLCIGSRQQRKV